MFELGRAAMGALLSVLAESKSRGFLGPGPIESHVDHARRFVVAGMTAPHLCLDIGSGGGVPGLVLALGWPDSHWALLDSMVKRCAFLREAVTALDLGERVSVLEDRAEVLAHDLQHRGQYDLVTARSFGRPATTAECAVGYLTLGGRLVISEPPDDTDRWPAAGLKILGLERKDAADPRIAVLTAVTPVGATYPRRVGVPAKRPLF